MTFAIGPLATAFSTTPPSKDQFYKKKLSEQKSSGPKLSTTQFSTTQFSKSKPSISIIVLAGIIKEPQLQRLFKSIEPQLPSFSCEVLLVHEAASLGISLPWLPSYVRYIPVEPYRGIPFNRNQGIAQAQGDIIVFIDDDCWVHDHWLAALVSPLLSDSSIQAITSRTIIPPSTFFGDCISALGFPGGGSLGFDKMWYVSPSGFTNHLAVGNCALRTSLFMAMGLFDEELKQGAEDAEFSTRLERASIPIKYESAAYAYHEARTNLRSFIHWQIRRGRANFHFKRKVGNIRSFVKLRFWSAKNILKHNLLHPRFPVVVGLLAMSFILQQWGYLRERYKRN